MCNLIHLTSIRTQLITTIEMIYVSTVTEWKTVIKQSLYKWIQLIKKQKHGCFNIHVFLVIGISDKEKCTIIYIQNRKF